MIVRGRRQVFRIGRAVSRTAAAMAVVMGAGLASAPAAQAAPPHSGRPKVSDHERTVDGRNLKVRPRSADPAGKTGPKARASWPKAGSAEVTLSGAQAKRMGSGQDLARAGKLPIWLAAPGPAPVTAAGARATAAPAPALKGQAKVAVLDQAAARKTGVQGLVFTLTPAAGQAAGRVGVQVDYEAFAQAFGGAYGTRLRLSQLPACSLTTPDKPECRTSTPLVTSNDGEKKILTADVTTAAPAAAGAQPAPAVIGVTAAPAGSQGNFAATSLDASAAWKVSGNTGDFTWNYPMKLPPVPGGLAPRVELGYSAQSVDGRAGNTNNQPSWAGEGFDYSPGFIERRYKTCEEDEAPKDPAGNSPGDLCWGYDNATVTWNGKGGELLKASDGTWRLRNDDGTRFERLVDAATANGDNDGEYWKVTTTDGTQYFFGRNRLPGWESGGEETRSAWTVPVFGDDATEPCNKATGFADSWCQQAWRWNLDMVVDPDGNAITYFYTQETNHYGRNLKPADATPYTRGGYLKGIEYGVRGTNVFASAPPARVLFDTSERCIPTPAFDCAPAKIATNAEQWWDVPWDMNCEAGTECKNGHGSTSPTFWSRKRLTKVTTQIDKGAGWPYRNVDSWTLNHQWGAVNDERDLLAKEIQHTGLAGATTAEDLALPKVTFNHVPMTNRLDQANDGIPQYTRYRVSKIFDESGGEIDVTYSGVDCSRSAPPTPETNTRRCYPSIWHLPGQTTPYTDWLNKYVVTSVVQKDRTGHAPDMATQYEYIGGAAWHFDDDDGLTRERFKTWSQWRGYGQIRVKTGSLDSPSTQTDTYYLRGMHGDRATAAGGTKTVTVADGEGGTHTDAEGLDGFTLKTVTFTAPGGTVHAKAVNVPWKQQTAIRARSWGTVTANAIQVDNTRTWTAMDGGTWRQSKTASVYETDPAKVGRVKQSEDLGDVSVANDDTCTRTEYADNLGKWMVAFPSRVETVSVNCATSPSRPDHIVSDVRTYYDGGGFGAAPTRGNATKSDEIAQHSGSSASYVTSSTTAYDSYGRPTVVTDAAGQATTNRYTETEGLTTKTVTVSPPATPGNPSTALTTIQDIDPARGLPLVKTDPNSQRTNLVYDSLGRLTKAWLPNRANTTQTPNYEFGYQTVDGQVAAVTTKTLANDGSQRVSSIELYDGWLRPRQTQTRGPEGRLISDTFYDAQGKAATKYDTYSATGAPAPTLFGVDAPGNVETQLRYAYDGLGRPTQERLLTGNGSTQEKWRTTYTYGGNWTAVDPPDGATPVSEITDVRGKVVERRQYTGGTPTGTYEATTYKYDPAGHPTVVTDPSGKVWKNTYDLRGRKTKTEDPDTGTTLSTFDDLDRTVSTTDGRGTTLFHSYDGLGRKLDVREGSANGPRTSSWTYDTAVLGKGMLAAATRHGTGGDYVTSVPSYDPLGRAESQTITIPSSEKALAGTYTYSQTYNLDGTPKTETLPAAGGLPSETLTRAYDDYQRPTRLTSPLATYVGTTDYTPTGDPKLTEMGTGNKRVWNTLTWEYGTQRLATSRTFREGIAGDDRNAAYQYDDAGNVLKISDAATSGTDTQCFRYDHLRRLTDAWSVSQAGCPQTPGTSSGPAPYRFHYTYGTDGNRKQEDVYNPAGAVASTRVYKYQGDPGVDPSVIGHRLGKVDQTGASPFTGPETNDETYSYDGAGNPTSRTVGSTAQTLTWNSEGRLSTITEGTSTTSFVYDADGNRIIRKDPSGSTLFLPGTELRLAIGAATAAGTRYYSHNDQTVAVRTAAGIRYQTGDHQGTAQITIKADNLQSLKRFFTPFGQPRATAEEESWPDEKGFLGGTKDPNGLTHLGAREYDPNTGRFISPDPVINFTDPQQMNGYGYAQNNPVTDSDPSGLCSPEGGCATNPCLPQGGHCGGASGDGGCYGDPSCIASGKPESTSINPNTCGQKCRLKVAATWIQQAIDEQRRREAVAKRLAWFYKNDPTKLDALRRFGLTPPLGDYVDPRAARARWQKILDSLFFDDAANCSEGSATGCVYFLSNFIPDGKAGVKGGGTFLDLLKAAVKSCSSFVPGTAVLMADGRYRSIEDLKAGDWVMATDPRTGRTEPQKVLATISSDGEKRLVQITTAQRTSRPFPLASAQARNSGSVLGAMAAKATTLTATDAHPFWVAGNVNRWVKAADLKAGMWLRTSDGTNVQVSGTKTWTSAHQPVHNLTVSGSHTYYVNTGSAPVLVHNTGPGQAPGCGSIWIDANRLNHHFKKHAADFGITAPESKASKAAFVEALREFVQDPNNIIIRGDYRGTPAQHYVNFRTGQHVSVDIRSGKLLAAYKSATNSDQFWYLTMHGKL